MAFMLVKYNIFIINAISLIIKKTPMVKHESKNNKEVRKVIKNLTKGLAVAVFAAALVAAPFFSSKASASHGNTYLESCALHYPVLGPGSSNQCVKMVQGMMNVAKLLYRQGGSGWPTVDPLDGKYGPETRAAVFSFQYYHKTHGRPYMKTDGIVGSQTWLVLAYECLYRWPGSYHYYSPYCVSG
jgi:putative peptidoglycan binding protein